MTALLVHEAFSAQLNCSPAVENTDYDKETGKTVEKDALHKESRRKRHCLSRNPSV